MNIKLIKHGIQMNLLKNMMKHINNMDNLLHFILKQLMVSNYLKMVFISFNEMMFIVMDFYIHLMKLKKIQSINQIQHVIQFN